MRTVTQSFYCIWSRAKKRCFPFVKRAGCTIQRLVSWSSFTRKRVAVSRASWVFPISVRHHLGRVDKVGAENPIIFSVYNFSFLNSSSCYSSYCGAAIPDVWELPYPKYFLFLWTLPWSATSRVSFWWCRFKIGEAHSDSSDRLGSLTCPNCGHNSYTWRIVRGHYDMKYIDFNAGFWAKSTLFGRQSVNVRNCNICRNRQLFAQWWSSNDLCILKFASFELFSKCS